MGQIKMPNPVKLIVSALAPGEGLLSAAREAVVAEWGAIDFESELLPFDHTTYYAPEFGPHLVRRIWAFVTLIDPAALPAIKVRSNEIEARWAVDGKRQVNLDPGYVSAAKLVLATTKNHGHRIYLGQGIYAEVTLRYRGLPYQPKVGGGKAFQPWPWTYPDYGTARYCALFEEIRKRYLEQLREK
jgi:hypothetical protein